MRNQWRIDGAYDDPKYPYKPNSPAFPPSNHLEASLELSAEGDAAVVLLDPLVITANGEWQVHFMANWIPGAHRFDFFWDFMQYECAGFFDLHGIDYIQSHADRATSTTRPDVTALFDACQALIRSATLPEGVKTAAQNIIEDLQNLVDQSLLPDAFCASLLVLAENLIRETSEQYAFSHNLGVNDYEMGIADAKRTIAKMIRDVLWSH